MTSLNNLPDIQFGYKDIETILADMITGYEKAYYEQMGKRIKLYPGDPLRIFIYSQALREFQLRQLIDFSAKQNLLKYSSGDYLENLGALVALVERQPASKAKATIKFTLSAPQLATKTIPKGTRVSPGKNIYFETLENTDVLAGVTEKNVLAECITAGTLGNGFTPGQISVLVDPLPWIKSVSNIDTSSGGADKEDDESYRERIRLAPEGYSVAGPEGAYEFFAKKYSSDIQDIKISSPSAGIVDIRILLKNGELPSGSFLQEVKDYLSDKKLRPLTDKVTVQAPEQLLYNVDIQYYIRNSDKKFETTIKDAVRQAVEDYIIWQKTKIGRDINPSELIAKIIAAGAKRVVVVSPVYTAISDTQVAAINTQTVIYGGLEDD